jgi:ParB-like chromosome segregation protein Spo0J
MPTKAKQPPKTPKQKAAANAPKVREGLSETEQELDDALNKLREKPSTPLPPKPEPEPEKPSGEAPIGSVKMSPIEFVPWSKIILNPDALRAGQPTQEEVSELMGSIRREGLHYPLLLDRGFILRAGTRRYWALYYLEAEAVPVRFIPRNVDVEAVELNNNELAIRFNHMDIAKRMVFHHDKNNMTERQIAEKYGWSQTKVHRYLLFAKAPPRIKSHVRSKDLSFTSATEILMKDPEAVKEAEDALGRGEEIPVSRARGQKTGVKKVKLPKEGLPNLLTGEVTPDGFTIHVAIPASVGDRKTMNRGLGLLDADIRKAVRDAVTTVWHQIQ